MTDMTFILTILASSHDKVNYDFQFNIVTVGLVGQRGRSEDRLNSIVANVLLMKQNLIDTITRARLCIYVYRVK